MLQLNRISVLPKLQARDEGLMDYDALSQAGDSYLDGDDRSVINGGGDLNDRFNGMQLGEGNGRGDDFEQGPSEDAWKDLPAHACKWVDGTEGLGDQD
jgi:hypothetical protein